MEIYKYYVYILSNKTNTVLYTGVTNNLSRIVFEHKNSLTKGFTSKYNVNKLVYFEMYDYVDIAISREKQIKGYSRQKKDLLIDTKNIKRDELYLNGKIIENTNNS